VSHRLLAEVPRESAVDTKLLEQLDRTPIARSVRRLLPREITLPPRRNPPRAAATALPPEAVARTTCAPPSAWSALATSAGGAVDVVVRAQFLRQLGAALATTVDRDNLESHVARVLYAEMAKPANAEHRDQVSPAALASSAAR